MAIVNGQDQDYDIAFNKVFRGHVAIYNWIRKQRRQPFLTRNVEYIRRARQENADSIDNNVISSTESKLQQESRKKRRRLEFNDLWKTRMKQEESPLTSRSKRFLCIRLDQIKPASSDRPKKRQLVNLSTDEKVHTCILELSLYRISKGDLTPSILYRTRREIKVFVSDNLITFGPGGLPIEFPQDFFTMENNGKLSSLERKDQLKWVISLHLSRDDIPSGLLQMCKNMFRNSVQIVVNGLNGQNKDHQPFPVFSVFDDDNEQEETNGLVNGRDTSNVPNIYADFITRAPNLVTTKSCLLFIGDAVNQTTYAKHGASRVPVYFASDSLPIQVGRWELSMQVNWIIDTREPLYPLPKHTIPQTLPSSTHQVEYRFTLPNFTTYYNHIVPNISCLFCRPGHLVNWKYLKMHLENVHGAFKYRLLPSTSESSMIVEISPLSHVEDVQDDSWDDRPISFEYFASRCNSTKIPNKHSGVVKQPHQIQSKSMKRIIHVPSKGKYFHSQTMYPIVNDTEIPDSDEEFNDEWMLVRNERDVDEIVNVADKEKCIMKLWKRLVHDYKPIGDIHVPDACLHFSKIYARTIQQAGLRREFTYHLLNMVQYGLINDKCYLSCLDVVDREIVSRKRRRELIEEPEVENLPVNS